MPAYYEALAALAEDTHSKMVALHEAREIIEAHDRLALALNEPWAVCRVSVYAHSTIEAEVWIQSDFGDTGLVRALSLASWKINGDHHNEKWRMYLVQVPGFPSHVFKVRLNSALDESYLAGSHGCLGASPAEVSE
ncbi:hypothetical protein FNU76_10310 [Chitinimonas arctica]|uniref:Uncharacterized protein n=1 Tax=Chitinimonas arctica TaxID=2594795 RepID=A0A516SEY5_9NEIS|nr:hypothetical protein [Chitinimonas arctica]QDQ26726.1 hypothetical protein FNU76_10310 [Chitinimonas arctica]